MEYSIGRAFRLSIFLIGRSLLLSSSLSMGGIAIWSMHFLGNRAIILHDGDPQYQLEYNPGFTALSFFLPILVLLLAYLLTGTNEKVSPLRVFSGGIFGGLAICGMHLLLHTIIRASTI